MDYRCKYCNKTFNKYWDNYNHEHYDCNKNINLTFSKDNYQINQSLFQHFYYLYQDQIISLRDSYLKKYKDMGYTHYNALTIARYYTLKDIEKLDDELQEKDGTWKCPICGIRIKDMGSHVNKVHNLSWEDFINKYNWSYSKIYFSSTYRNNLRNNKLNYYNNTEDGLQAKKELSNRFSGDNNPSKRIEVRQKISRSRTGQKLSRGQKESISKSYSGMYCDDFPSRGYSFYVIHNGKELRLRSKNEYLIYLMLTYYNIQFEYEPFRVEYYNPAKDMNSMYLVDFVVDNNLFEAKQKESDFEKDEKYYFINQSLNSQGKQLKVITPNNIGTIFNIDSDKLMPITFFEGMIIDNIFAGNCKVVLPQIHNGNFKNSKFLHRLGENYEKIISEGILKYEDKKHLYN